MRDPVRHRATILGACLAVVVIGCAHKPPPPSPPYVAPAARVSVRYFAGGVLSGPTSRPAVSDLPAAALEVRATFVSLERAPQAAYFEPVASRATLVAASQGGAAVIADPRLTRGAEIVPPSHVRPFIDALNTGKIGRTAPITQTVLAIPSGAAGEVDLFDSVTSPDPLSDRPATARLAVTAFHPRPSAGGDDLLQLALIVRRKPADSGTFQEETVLLDPIDVARPSEMALVVPFTFSGHRSWGVAALLHVGHGPAQADFGRAVARAAAAARAATVAVATRPTTAPSAGPAERAAAVALLGASDRQRQALAFLAEQTGATVCLDAARAADDKTLASLCQRISPRAASAVNDPRAMSWVLEGQTLALLSEQSEAGTLPAELTTVLSIHAGEVGRHPATLQDVIKSATDRQGLAARITSENLLFLEDSSPATRVRAFEWLATRGLGPAGYDPLGPSRQRRAALDRALAPATGPAAGEAAHE